MSSPASTRRASSNKVGVAPGTLYPNAVGTAVDREIGDAAKPDLTRRFQPAITVKVDAAFPLVVQSRHVTTRPSESLRRLGDDHLRPQRRSSSSRRFAGQPDPADWEVDRPEHLDRNL